jgi:hypothetical protein
MFAIHEQQARDLMTTFAGIAQRVVVASSIDVYWSFGRVNKLEGGEVDPSPITENSPLRTKLYPFCGETPRPEDDPEFWLDYYDKILVERVVPNHSVSGTILRLPGRASTQLKISWSIPAASAKNSAIASISIKPRPSDAPLPGNATTSRRRLIPSGLTMQQRTRHFLNELERSLRSGPYRSDTRASGDFRCWPTGRRAGARLSVATEEERANYA